MLRDARGIVLLHSRRCFEKMMCFEDAKLVVLIWTIESMGFHRLNSVIFASEHAELVGSVNRPMA